MGSTSKKQKPKNSVAGTMSYRSLGRCGTKVSAFGLGGWTTFGNSVTDARTIRNILHIAFDAGVNFFDTADIYAKGACERAMGKVLRDFPRHQLVISTKVFWPMSDDVNDRGLSRKHIMESVDRSLKRLSTHYIDIYFCHRFDEQTPIDETARAMDDLIHQGKILYWGTSEWSGSQLRDIHALCRRHNLYPPQVEQPQYSLLSRAKFENDVRPAAAETGMGVVVWSPLGSGLLTGKYDDHIPKNSRLAQIGWLRDEIYKEETIERIRRFKPYAETVGFSRAQLSLAWVAAQPGISSVILGATKASQVQENLGALSVNLGSDIMTELQRLFPA